MPDSKLPDVGTTIFTVMSQLAADCGALNLSQGFPDFAAPEGLLERVTLHLRAGHNQYAPMSGVPELREQVALKTERLYGRRTNPATEVTVTSGATEALFCAIQAFVRSGDEVIVLDPAYDAYDPATRLAGGRTVHVPLTPPAFGVDWQRVQDAITPRTRMIVVNSPHNPTGAVLSAADLDTLAAITRDRPVVVLSDEVYEHIIFDGARHESLLRHPELSERSLVVSSFGKTYHATGWKIGYCVASTPLMAEFRKVHQFVQFCVVTPMQLALADFLESTPRHYLDLPGFYQAKRDLFCELLASSRLRVTPSRGTYFQLVDYGAVSRENDVDYARRLTREAGVACIPISVFMEQPPEARWLRFCFAKTDSTLRAAAQILCRL
jgi:methionine aminotransferase